MFGDRQVVEVKTGSPIVIYKNHLVPLAMFDFQVLHPNVTTVFHRKIGRPGCEVDMAFDLFGGAVQHGRNCPAFDQSELDPQAHIRWKLSFAIKERPGVDVGSDQPPVFNFPL